MLNFLTWFTILLAVLLIVGLVAIGWLCVQLSKSVRDLNSRIEKLTTDVSNQAVRLSEIQAQIAAQNANPLSSVNQLVGDWKKSGPLLAIGTLATRLFQSYWKKRRQQALPVTARKEKEK